jgi:branched-chain amino acid transport system ATP-binding protein
MVRDQTEEILTDIGLIEQADTLAGKLAYGDQKSLEFGIALTNSPKLVLLDEPTGGMSPEESTAITNLIREVVKRRKITLLFVEHDMRVVFGVSERITVMNRGQKVAEGSPEEISRNEEVRKIYLGEG